MNARDIKKGTTLRINGETFIVTFSRRSRRYTGEQMVQGYFASDAGRIDQAGTIKEFSFKLNESIEVA